MRSDFSLSNKGNKKEVLSLQPMIPPKRFHISPPDLSGGCSEGLDAFIHFFKQQRQQKSGVVFAAHDPTQTFSHPPPLTCLEDAQKV